MTSFVAVHGAGTGGWLFDDLAERLRSAGHRVVAPSLVGVGDLATPDAASTNVSTHVDQVAALVDSERIAGAVLLGFSYGGHVITGVARRVPHAVTRLVFLDAFVPEPDRCLFDQLPSPVRDAMTDAAERFGDGWRFPPAPVQAVGGVGALERGVDPARVDSVLARPGAHPIGTYTQPSERTFCLPSSFPAPTCTAPTSRRAIRWRPRPAGRGRPDGRCTRNRPGTSRC